MVMQIHQEAEEGFFFFKSASCQCGLIESLEFRGLGSALGWALGSAVDL